MIVAAAALAFVPACPPERIEPERLFEGVFVDEFEGQSFYLGARAIADVDRRAPQTYMPLDIVGVGAPFGIVRREQNMAYRVRFVGQRRTRGVDGIPCGYGHMNHAVAEVSAIRVLAIEPLGPSVSSDSPR